jgi:hypothetical protein
MSQPNNWSWWKEALAGGTPETTPGHPHPGFYRDQHRRVVAIWYTEEETPSLMCATSAGYVPTEPDEIDELFSRVCRTPITRDFYLNIRQGGEWPATIGHNNPPPELSFDKQLEWKIEAYERQCKKWLETLPGGKPQTQLDADICANYAAEFAKIESEAAAMHKMEKEPHLKKCREIDGKWLNPIRDVAERLKKQIKLIASEWLIAENARRKQEALEEQKRHQEALDKLNEQMLEEARAHDMLVPERVIAPPVEFKPASAGTTSRSISQRTRKVFEIEDYAKVAAFFSSQESVPDDLKNVLQKLVNAACKTGVKVPGVKAEISTSAA